MRLVFWVGIWTIVIDQVSKYLVIHTMNLAQLLEIKVWPPYLNFSMAWNYGINFGILAQDNAVTRWSLITVALVISGVVLWWVHHDPSGRWQKIAAGLLVGGALGNVIDRLIYGAVADFINMSCCSINNPFAFNIADISVFAGAFGMIIFTTDKKAS